MPTATTRQRHRAPRPDLPKLRSIAVGAEFLDVDHRTIRRMIHDGKLRAYRVNRLIKIDMNEVEQLVATPVPPESVGA
jgi:excisionase family DNA binding protein